MSWITAHIHRKIRRAGLVAALGLLFISSLAPDASHRLLVAAGLLIGAALASWWD